ncbi:MAG: isocitrate lyase/PEP mutase family protein [Solirubrobacteraceae bacterium]
MSDSAKRLRERLRRDEIVVAIGAHDPFTALIASTAGMDAVYQGGYAVAAHHHGLPDIGLIGLADVAQALARITSVSDIPVIVDADTGYGRAPGVARTVRELEMRGAAAIQLEDQVFPKRCGHMEGKRVVEREEMVAKVKAAVAARADENTVIIARTDALAVNGLDDALERCAAYAAAGADMTFVDAAESREHLRTIAAVTGRDALAMTNMTETGRTPSLTAHELEELGYAMVIFPSTQSWIFAQAYANLCAELRRTGTTAGLQHLFTSFSELNELVGRSHWESWEEVAK